MPFDIERRLEEVQQTHPSTVTEDWAWAAFALGAASFMYAMTKLVNAVTKDIETNGING